MPETIRDRCITPSFSPSTYYRGKLMDGKVRARTFHAVTRAECAGWQARRERAGAVRQENRFWSDRSFLVRPPSCCWPSSFRRLQAALLAGDVEKHFFEVGAAVAVDQLAGAAAVDDAPLLHHHDLGAQ